MPIQDQEAQIIMAMEAIRSTKSISCRRAASIYQVPETTLRARINGRPPRSDTRPKVQNLTDLEEQVIVNNILDLDSRGFPPQLADVENMANYLQKTRRARPVRKL
jgi:hypothetical protein